MSHRLILLSLLLISIPTWGLDFSVLAYQSNLKTQDYYGKDKKDPVYYGASLGHRWNIDPNLVFAPHLSYIHNTQKSEDSYSDYKIQLYHISMDFLYRISDLHQLDLRLGLGNLYRITKGQGGTVTIPNGSGTATAYRPSGTSTSQTATLNMGLEWRFTSQFSISTTGLVIQPMETRKRSVSYLISFTYFGGSNESSL